MHLVLILTPLLPGILSPSPSFFLRFQSPSYSIANPFTLFLPFLPSLLPSLFLPLFLPLFQLTSHPYHVTLHHLLLVFSSYFLFTRLDLTYNSSYLPSTPSSSSSILILIFIDPHHHPHQSSSSLILLIIILHLPSPFFSSFPRCDCSTIRPEHRT